MSVRIVDLRSTEVEHLVGVHLLASGSVNPGLVLLRVLGSGSEIMVGHLSPEIARQLGQQLFEAAARAEYEGDFLIAARAAGIDDKLVGGVMRLIRRGETARCDLAAGDRRPDPPDPGRGSD
jgi:hypothetical protein